MEKREWGYVGLLVAVGLLMFIWFGSGASTPPRRLSPTSVETPPEQSADQRSGKPPLPTKLVVKNATGASSGDAAESNKMSLSEAMRDLILGCTKGHRAFANVASSRDFATLDEFIRKALATNSAGAASTVVQQNVHIVDESGKQLRLQISPRSGESEGESAEIKMYSVDAEGLPVREKLPRHLRGVLPEEAVAKFQAMGETTLEETTETVRFDEDSSARLIRRQGKVSQLEIYFPGGGLNCESNAEIPVSCRCL